MRHRSARVVVLAGGATLVVSSVLPTGVAAQSTTPTASSTTAPVPLPGASSATPAEAPPPASRTVDLVILESGARYRGIIFELVPGDHVTIQLPTGEARLFAMAEVRYAGAASDAPKASDGQGNGDERRHARAPRAEPRGDAGEHLVHLVAEQPDVTFWAAGPEGDPGAAGFTRLCDAPCEVSLAAGSYRFALAQSDAPPRTSKLRVEIAGDTTVRGTVVSRQRVRNSGWLLLGVGGGGGVALLLASSNASGNNTKNTLTGLGAGSAVVSALIGVPLALTSDSVTVESAPHGGVALDESADRDKPISAIGVAGFQWSTRF